MSGSSGWPAVAGTYEVGDPQAPVAVCTLTSERLVAPIARLHGVAIAGKVYTANLGIERIVTNVTTNPAIRFFLICGKDSPLFHPGQSLVALAEHGIDAEHRIVGAIGYEPVLPALALERVAQFRRQVEVIDWSGEEDLVALEQAIEGFVARNPGRFAGAEELTDMPQAEEQFVSIRPGGQREPLQYDPKGYFVITLDREDEQIVMRHYLPDHMPAHEMRGRSAGPMLLGLLREGLVTQLSHAGYLGEELAKAQAALQLGLRYDQDRPLRAPETPNASADALTPAPTEQAEAQGGMPAPTEQAEAQGGMPAPTAPTMPEASPAMPRMANIAPPMTRAQLRAAAPGAEVDIVVAVANLPASDLLAGTFLEPDEAELFTGYRRTEERVTLRWTPTTRVVMGETDDLHADALVRARGTLDTDGVVAAQQLVILTRVARIIGDAVDPGEHEA